MTDYYDIDDILATEERVNSTFKVDVYNLGYLDSSSTKDNVLAAETKVTTALTPIHMHNRAFTL